MPASEPLKRLGGGRWETKDGRFAIEPQSGTWVIVDNEQIDELGLPLVRGPFGSLTAAKDAIESARTEGPKASPLAGRLAEARKSEDAGSTTPGSGSRTGSAAGEARRSARKVPAEPSRPPEPRGPDTRAEPKWLRDLAAADQRRARDLIARLERMDVDDPERIVRSEIADAQPALVRLAIERALAKALAASKDQSSAVRAAVKTILRGADVELGVGWKVVDDEGRRIDKVDLPE
jgi:hypothetical protein